MAYVLVLRTPPPTTPPAVETSVTLPLTADDFVKSGKQTEVSLPYNIRTKRIPFTGYTLEVHGSGYNDLQGTLVYIPCVYKDRWTA